MKITSKGQVTIPQAVREKAGFFPNTEVEIVLQGHQVVIRRSKKKRSRGEALVQALTGKGTGTLTTDQIMALTRGDK